MFCVWLLIISVLKLMFYSRFESLFACCPTSAYNQCYSGYPCFMHKVCSFYYINCEAKMKKSELISKYEHQLTLKNYSGRTLKAYVNGLNIFLEYVQMNGIHKVSSQQLSEFFYHCKKELGYGYSMMKQLLASVWLFCSKLTPHSVSN